MSIYSIVTEEDMINLRKLAEKQKDQRVLKIKNKILKQTHDIKLAENLSPKTKSLDEVKKSAEKIGEVIEKSQTEINVPQPAIEQTQLHHPLANNEGVMYDTELEDIWKNMKKNRVF